MNAKVRFALGALFTPVLLLEDGLRKAGMDIPAEGMLHNAEGKSVSEVWAEAGEQVQNERKVDALLAQTGGVQKMSVMLNALAKSKRTADSKSVNELDDAVEDAIRFAKEHGIPL